MKRLSNTFLALAIVAFALGVKPSDAQAEAATNITATLILGTNEGGGVDPSLRRFERHLKRLSRFDTFKQKGRGSSSVSVPGNGAISVGNGHRVTISVTSASNDRLRIATKWTSGNRVLVNTTVVAPRNQPTVLGAPSQGSGQYILLLVAR